MSQAPFIPKTFPFKKKSRPVRAVSDAESDAVDGVGRDFGIRFFSVDPEHNAGRGGDGGCGGEGLTEPALSAAFVHLHCHLQKKTTRGTLSEQSEKFGRFLLLSFIYFYYNYSNCPERVCQDLDTNAQVAY